jgi:hypothetical protein
MSSKTTRGLKVRKLKGRLPKFHRFLIDYKNRIVFIYESRNKVVLLSIGDHDLYR